MSSLRSRHLWLLLVSVVVIGSLAPIGVALAGGKSELSKVKKATARYHDLDKAIADGYERFLECFDLPGVGGMGQHYVDLAALDGEAEATHPEAMVYEVRGDRLKLVAVEYVIPQSEWSDPEPPSLFGQSFHRNDNLGIWALHAWIWRPNPLGLFEDWNPRVRLCP
ncbi:MAG: hypothetical protein ACRDHO_15525 [Actinomycetota bacterium]